MRSAATVERFLAEALGSILLVFIGGGTAAVAALSNLTPHGFGTATLALVTLAQVSPLPLRHPTLHANCRAALCQPHVLPPFACLARIDIQTGRTSGGIRGVGG